MRHGETALNDPKNPKMRAWKDVPLDERGKDDVRRTATRLKQYKPGYVYSSDLMRDTETADIIANTLNVARENDFGARTWDMGSFEGQPISEVNPAVEGLYRRPWERPPGSSESFNDFQERWCGFLEDKMYTSANIAAMRPIVIVSHGKNIALAYSYVEMTLPEKGIMPEPSGFAIININPDRSMAIEMVTKTEPVIEDV